jgi:hypothetical protein
MAAGQLTLVAVGVVSVDLRRLGPLGLYLDDYCHLSGADADYGFFAPDVTDQIEAHFEITDLEGHQKPVFLSLGSNHEADVVVGDIIDNFQNPDPEVRSSLATSLAGQIFADHPEAVRVMVRVQVFETVSMEEFRDGARPRRTPLYEATLARGGEQTEEKRDGTIAP